MPTTEKVFLSATLTELTTAGFGFLDYLQEDGLFVRLTRMQGSVREPPRYRYEILTPATALTPKRERNYKVVKWWKCRVHVSVIRRLIGMHAAHPLNVDQEFMLDTHDLLVPGSQKAYSPQ